VRFNQPRDKIYGLFVGTFGHQVVAKQTFRDDANDLTAVVEYGSYMFRRQDYVWGEIKQGDRKVSEITGNYCGFLDFNEVRYWDYREKDSLHFPIEPLANHLPSDASERTDGQFLRLRPVEEAQAEKERLEDI